MKAIFAQELKLITRNANFKNSKKEVESAINDISYTINEAAKQGMYSTDVEFDYQFEDKVRESVLDFLRFHGLKVNLNGSMLNVSWSS